LKYTINNNCIACGNCAVVCNHDAIETGYNQSKMDMGTSEFGDPFIINDKCIGCGECVSVCWPEAIDPKFLIQ